jgi:hypothetical protein
VPAAKNKTSYYLLDLESELHRESSNFTTEKGNDGPAAKTEKYAAALHWIRVGGETEQGGIERGRNRSKTQVENDFTDSTRKPVAKEVGGKRTAAHAPGPRRKPEARLKIAGWIWLRERELETRPTLKSGAGNRTESAYAGRMCRAGEPTRATKTTKRKSKSNRKICAAAQ